jgi:hypothetical protein
MVDEVGGDQSADLDGGKGRGGGAAGVQHGEFGGGGGVSLD